MLAAWAGSSPLAAQTVAPADPAAEHGQVLRRYCVGCHNDRTLTAGLTLQSLDLSRIGLDAHETEVWEKVIRKLSTRSMPPADRPRPEDATYDELTAWIAGRIDAAAAERPDPGRRHAVHRLNRAEYANAIRDLLALDIDERTLLPPDDSGFGFDNIADVLSVSPMLTERYLAASRKIARLAVGDPALQPTTEVFEVDKNLRQNERVGDDLPFGSRGGLAVDHYFQVDGEYVVKIFLLRTYDGRVRGMLEPHALEVRLDGALVESLTVGGPILDEDGNPTRRDLRNVPDDGQEVRFAAKAGPATLAVSFVDQQAYLEGMRRPDYRVTSYEYAGDQTVPPGIGSVELRGPYNVTGRGDTPSRQRIFTCRPATAADETPCATEIATRIARRAFRRPVTDGDIEMLLGFFEAGRARGDFDAGIEMALRRILVSPDFLFRRETDPADIGPGESYAISDLELASRLSFFLWSSIPDDELLDATGRGELRDPDVLGAQVRRMLADPRTRALVDNFGGQWLYLRNMPLVTPDPQAFPEFDTNLREAMAREMTLFLDSQIREDRSVLDLLTADYTFVNERLADHYGMPSIYGNHFRRVELGGPHAVAPGPARQGQPADRHLLRPPHVAGAARQMAAREHPRHAAAAAAARRPRARGERRSGPRPALGPRPARAAPRQPGLRELPSNHGPARVRARELRRGRALARRGRGRHGDRRQRHADGRHAGRRSRHAAAGAARPGRELRDDGGREAADLRDRARGGIVRRTRRPQHRGRGGR